MLALEYMQTEDGQMANTSALNANCYGGSLAVYFRVLVERSVAVQAKL